jgi:serine/threonine-protein kinase
VRLEVLSDPVPVIEHVVTLETGATEFSLSQQGPLLYVPGGGLTGVTRELVWVNRHGQEERLKAPPRAYVYPRLSTDGMRLALDIRDQENDIWIWDLARQTLTRVTTDPALDAYPVWTPDGRRVIFASARAGILNLFWQSADNSGIAERLTTSPNPQSPDSISPDGTQLIFGELVAQTGTDLEMLRMDFSTTGTGAGQRKTEPLVHTTFSEENGELSPDGRWLAYQSNESGQYEVYVRPFPNVDSGHWQISTSGGTAPVWARSGRELFYRDGTHAVTAVPIVGPNFSAGIPIKLFDGRYFAATGRTYDVSPDGQRFLMIKDNAAGDQTSTLASMVVVFNWVEELKARVPTK